MSGSAKVIGSISVTELFGEKRITVKPNGHHFIGEIAKAAGLSYSHTSRKLQLAYDAGEVERVTVFVRGKGRNAYKVAL